MSGGAWPWAALSRCASVARPRPDTQAHPPTPSLSGPRAFLSRWREHSTGAGRSVVEMTYQGGLASRSNPNRDLLVKLNLAGL